MFVCCVYFLRSIRNTAIAIPASMAIVEPARYVSVIGPGVGVGSGVGCGACSTFIAVFASEGQ
ncbi:hypothetical protein JJE00_06600 [Candidatus Bathyarchaeota archaeon]|nr:hypothetical protein [Candidatus Bathyarchaeota archaeon]